MTNVGERIIVAPSLLAADFSALADEIRRVEQGGADWLHLDIMDGHFVPNITFGPMLVGAVRRLTDLPLDVHLMIAPPEPYLHAFVEQGADILTVHWEATPHVHRCLQRIRELGVRAGVAINPGTPWQAVEPLLGDVDLILVMTVNPGFGGQAFLPATLAKLEAIRDACRRAGVSPRLEVDGGIDPQTGRQALAAGADVLVAGSSVFGAPDPAAAVATLKALRP